MVIDSASILRMTASTGMHRTAARCRAARLHGTVEVPADGAALLGEHTREILEKIAGIPADVIDELLVAGTARVANKR